MLCTVYDTLCTYMIITSRLYFKFIVENTITQLGKAELWLQQETCHAGSLVTGYHDQQRILMNY